MALNPFTHAFPFLLLLLLVLRITTTATALAASLASKETSPSPISSPEGMLVEDKIRLGSTPPSCHNRCNECNPCMAVQVPTLPQGLAGIRPEIDNRPALYNSYSNYKPLGWKCRCGNRLFNP